MAKAGKLKLFYSYSKEDEPFRAELEKHLSLLQRQGVIESWHPGQILPGSEADQEISRRLQEADIILLLLSADFIAGASTYELQLSSAMQRHRQRQARVIPVLLRAADYTGAPFSRLPVLSANGLPIASSPDRDAAWAEVVSHIRLATEQVRPAAAATHVALGDSYPTQHRPRRLPWRDLVRGLAGGLVGIAVVVAGWSAIHREPKATPSPAPAERAPASTPRLEPAGPAPASIPTQAEATVRKPEAIHAQVKLLVRAVPPQATVQVGAERVRQGDPLLVKRGQVPLEVVVSAGGYRSLRLQMVPAEDQSVSIQLEPDVTEEQRAAPARGSGQAPGDKPKRPRGKPPAADDLDISGIR
jgi:hypothetical protein